MKLYALITLLTLATITAFGQTKKVTEPTKVGNAKKVTNIKTPVVVKAGAPKHIDKGSGIQSVERGPDLLDKDIRADLNAINEIASTDMTAFTEYVAGHYTPQREQVAKAINKFQFTPGDVVMGLEISKVTKVPFQRVVSVHRSGGNKSWGVTAKKMGIKSGSPRFHRLKTATKQSTIRHREVHQMKQRQKKIKKEHAKKKKHKHKFKMKNK